MTADADGKQADRPSADRPSSHGGAERSGTPRSAAPRRSPDDAPPGPNRAALLTPPGAAAIAVVRLTGPLVADFLRQHFSRPTAAGRCVHGTLSDGDTILDDPVIVTGNNFADLNLHGGPWVVRSVLDLARRRGFEVSHSAVADVDAADGLTLLEREVSAHLAHARTELAVRYLAAQPALWDGVRGRGLPGTEIDAALANPALTHLLHPPRVAIIGIPNVGKSTLANQLFGRERSIVADVPGTTRDWVGELANVDGLAVMLVDTPGLRDTPDPIERQAIARSRTEIESAELVIALIDPTQSPAPQQAILAAHPAAPVVANKSDLRGTWDPPPTALRVAASSGDNIEQLRSRIRRHFRINDTPAPACWTPRQRTALEAIRAGTASPDAFFTGS